MNTESLPLNLANEISRSDLYREAGYYYRHLCVSRTSVLSVGLPTIFGVDLILLRGSSNLAEKIALLAFALVMYVIVWKSNNFFARKIDGAKKALKDLETLPDLVGVHSNIDRETDKDKEWLKSDLFSMSVYLVGGVGIFIFFMILWAQSYPAVAKFLSGQ